MIYLDFLKRLSESLGSGDYLESLSWQNYFEDMIYQEYFCIRDMLRMGYSFYEIIFFDYGR